MAGKRKHVSRSRKTYRSRMRCARIFRNYSMTRLERMLLYGR